MNWAKNVAKGLNFNEVHSNFVNCIIGTEMTVGYMLQAACTLGNLNQVSKNTSSCDLSTSTWPSDHKRLCIIPLCPE